jgi:hypothetical protein
MTAPVEAGESPFIRIKVVKGNQGCGGNQDGKSGIKINIPNDL